MNAKQIKTCILLTAGLYMFLSLINTAVWKGTPYSHAAYYLKEQLFFIITCRIWLIVFDHKWQKSILWSVIFYKIELMSYTLCKFYYPETEVFLNIYYDLIICSTIIIFTLITFYFYTHEHDTI
jgi:hypothetical protein